MVHVQRLPLLLGGGSCRWPIVGRPTCNRAAEMPSVANASTPPNDRMVAMNRCEQVGMVICDTATEWKYGTSHVLLPPRENEGRLHASGIQRRRIESASAQHAAPGCAGEQSTTTSSCAVGALLVPPPRAASSSKWQAAAGISSSCSGGGRPGPELQAMTNAGLSVRHHHFTSNLNQDTGTRCAETPKLR